MRLYELLNEDPRTTQQSDSRPPLSVRNYNPGNIRVGDDWQGMIGSENGFVKFETPEMGARAMAKVLNNYQSRYGLDTLEGIISRWAPPSENDTQSYIKYVADRVGIDPNETIDFRENPELQTSVMTAMTSLEGGPGSLNTFTPDVLRSGVNLAANTDNQSSPSGSESSATLSTRNVTIPATGREIDSANDSGFSLSDIVNVGQIDGTTSSGQPQIDDPRFDRSSLAPVGTTQYNLRRGSSGENVSNLQSQLQNLGYDIGETGVDGKFGPRTAAAVRQFQQDYGLQVDSIVGDQTMSALKQTTPFAPSTPNIPSPIRQSSMPSTPEPTPTPLRTQGPSQI